MILYNVTIKPDWDIHEAWVEWMKGEHFNDMQSTGLIKRCQLLRLLDMDESDGPTYACQYFLDGLADYQEYLDKFADDMRQRGDRLWAGKYVAFRSLMEIVN
ncbi:MAG: DUF4286 family protein [Gemmatimonadaceae bacterium]|nr:DUF4286 family protein [Chitinophagaceae bacterium]